jgi:hypothetical protein
MIQQNVKTSRAIIYTHVGANDRQFGAETIEDLRKLQSVMCTHKATELGATVMDEIHDDSLTDHESSTHLLQGLARNPGVDLVIVNHLSDLSDDMSGPGEIRMNLNRRGIELVAVTEQPHSSVLSEQKVLRNFISQRARSQSVSMTASDITKLAKRFEHLWDTTVAR